jgi:hypothetical protein
MEASPLFAGAPVDNGRSKTARGGGDHERAQPTARRCKHCGGTRHDARTCKKDTQTSSQSDASTMYLCPLFDSEMKLKIRNIS